MAHYAEQNRELALCLARMSAGDRDAFRVLYTLTSAKLYAIAFNMVRDEALTHDILQQSYLSIWTHASRFDPAKGKPFTWMLVITRRKALDIIRKRGRVSVTEQLPERLEDEHACSERGARSLLLRRLIEPHLVRLSAEMRDAVILSAVYGLTSREIGERSGVSTNTAKSWVRRGLATLRRDIDADALETLL